MKFLILITLMGCFRSAKSDNALLFHQELSNYGFVRYENAEVICYMQGESLSCMKK